jgi:hypothetical protein
MELDDFRSFPAPGSRLRNHAPCKNRTYNPVIKSFFYGFQLLSERFDFLVFPREKPIFILPDISRFYAKIKLNRITSPYHPISLSFVILHR